ncbi:Hypothetical predicted protein [Mytilus galloprovincialis]|uniref:Tesmin/TSO1-like CXC domain-containing protein n=1 Tax=Mytilus galloprovincialis TaxID=29158 RepID=A0A8B6DEH6_MYTGA|nr:Hypothetical predicted protein [Mytilus galloprovincialis]
MTRWNRQLRSSYANGQLKHAFNSKVVLTDVQRSDLLNLQKIAQGNLGKNIKICQSDGIFRYNKTSKIATFSTKTHSISKVKRKLKDQRTENSLLRKQIAWSKEQNTPISDLQQFISLPCAIVDHDGLPYKGDKSKTLVIYHSRYPEAFENKLHFKPDCVIIDGMFILNSKPLKSSNRLFAHFLVSLFNRWTIPYIQLNTKEIHIVFDDQSPQLSPKDIERKRRDDKAETAAKILILETTKIPSDWQAFLHNRENKKQLVQLVSEKFLHFAKIALNSSQSFVIGGGFESASITKVVEENAEKIATNLQTNISEEIDGQLDVVWDSPENLQKVINNIKLWTAGCNCLKSDCNSKICGCTKINMACGPGCKCGSSCKNKNVNSQVCNTEETEENTAEAVASTRVLNNSESDGSDFGDDTMDGKVFFELQNVDDGDLQNIIFNFQYQQLA